MMNRVAVPLSSKGNYFGIKIRVAGYFALDVNVLRIRI